MAAAEAAGGVAANRDGPDKAASSDAVAHHHGIAGAGDLLLGAHHHDLGDRLLGDGFGNHAAGLLHAVHQDDLGHHVFAAVDALGFHLFIGGVLLAVLLLLHIEGNVLAVLQGANNLHPQVGLRPLHQNLVPDMHHIGVLISRVHGAQLGKGHIVFPGHRAQGFAGLDGVVLGHHGFPGQISFHIGGRDDGGDGIQPVHHLHLLDKFGPLVGAAVAVGAEDVVQHGVQFGPGFDRTFKFIIDIQAADLGDGIARGAEDLVTQGGFVQLILLVDHRDGQLGRPLHLKGVIRIVDALHRHGGRLVVHRFVGNIPQLLAVVFENQAESQAAPIPDGEQQHERRRHGQGQVDQADGRLAVPLNRQNRQEQGLGNGQQRVAPVSGAHPAAGLREALGDALALAGQSAQMAEEQSVRHPIEKPPDRSEETGQAFTGPAGQPRRADAREIADSIYGMKRRENSGKTQFRDFDQLAGDGLLILFVPVA